MDIMDLLGGAGNIPLPGLGGGPLPGMGGGVPIQDMSGQAPSLPLPPSMPVTQALAGRQQQTDPLQQLLALAGQGGGQQPSGIPIQALRMMLFQQLNQPGKGPFTAIVNPIVAALTARQIAPYYQAQQEAAQAKTRLDNLQSAAAITSSMSQAEYNKERAAELQRKAAAWDNLPQEDKERALRIQQKLDPTAGEELQAESSKATRESREKTAEEARKSREETARLNREAQDRRTIYGATKAAERLERKGVLDQEGREYTQGEITQRHFDKLNNNQAIEDQRMATRLLSDARKLAAQKDAAAAKQKYEKPYRDLQMRRTQQEIDANTETGRNLKYHLDIMKSIKDEDVRESYFYNTFAPAYELHFETPMDLEDESYSFWSDWWSGPKLKRATPPPKRTAPTSVEEQANQLPADTPNDPMGSVIDTGKKRKFTLGQ